MYALDALFGLPRKKSAGISQRPAIQGHLFFCDQVAVDEFVSTTPSGKHVVQVHLHVGIIFVSQHLSFVYIGLQ